MINVFYVNENIKYEFFIERVSFYNCISVLLVMKFFIDRIGVIRKLLLFKDFFIFVVRFLLLIFE